MSPLVFSWCLDGQQSGFQSQKWFILVSAGLKRSSLSPNMTNIIFKHKQRSAQNSSKTQLRLVYTIISIRFRTNRLFIFKQSWYTVNTGLPCHQFKNSFIIRDIMGCKCVCVLSDPLLTHTCLPALVGRLVGLSHPSTLEIGIPCSS